MTAEQKLAVAEEAILYALRRIQKDKDIQAYFGVGTTTFDYLTAAYSELADEPLDKVRDQVIPGSSDIPHSTAQDILATLPDPS